MFVPGKPFPPNLVFKDKHSSLLRNLFMVQAPGVSYHPGSLYVLTIISMILPYAQMLEEPEKVGH